jgi:UPF0755 protein
MKKVILIVICFVAGFLSYKLGFQFYLNQKVNNNENKIVYINKGYGLNQVAQLLSENSIINYPSIFTKVGRIQRLGDQVKFGEYEIKSTDTYKDLYRKFTKGEILKHQITFIEGDHLYKYARLVAEKGLTTEAAFLKAVRDPQLIQSLLGIKAKTLEGYLFPETYYFTKNDGSRLIVKTMVRNFLRQTKNLNFSNSGMTRHEAITLASIIEKETGAPKERPLISSVFHNRMKKKMRLQTDPTITYGMMDKTGKEVFNIRKKDILAPTDYNTYVIKGLPPGPISNPGIASIKAALNPEKTNYLFFVSQNDGTHIFSENYSNHTKAVNKYQKDPSQRKGKSWRDLNKK